MENHLLLDALVQNEKLLSLVSSVLPDSLRAALYGFLAFELISRFDRTGSMDDLNRAITMNEQAVAWTPEDHPNRGAMLTNLGNVLQRRFDRTGSMDDLNRAITTNEQ